MINGTYPDTLLATTAGLLLLALLVFGTAIGSEQEFTPMSLFEGLHITGTPVDVDIETYRLTVTGQVHQELALSFEDVKSMAAMELKLVLDCPGFFTDTGVWTGVPVKEILAQAGLHPEAKTVIFSTADESYRTRMPVEEVLATKTMLIAYRFEGREFHRVHGFPLRLVAGGKEGSDWVKWLGQIIVE